MKPIQKRHLVDERNRRVAVQIDLATFEKIEELLENYGLVQSMAEERGAETLDLEAARAFYDTLDKAP